MSLRVPLVIGGDGRPQQLQSGDWLTSSLAGAEIGVTGATTATIDRMHVCSGTSADYTVTLPAASGNAGRRLWFRMAPLASLSKLVTLDGNASETIDGSLTRVMWAGETCELLCDGSNWFKVSGRTIPMMCLMEKSSTTSLANSTVTAAPLDYTAIDNTGRMANAGSNRIDILRTGTYTVYPKISGNGTGSNGAQSRVHKNGTLIPGGVFAGYLDPFGSLTGPLVFSLSAGDNCQLYAYQASGGSITIYGAATDTATSILVVETPTW